MNEPLTVEWVDFNDPRLSDDKTIGWMGGWVRGEQWDEYLKLIAEQWHPYMNAVKDSIIANNIKCTGSEHSEGEGFTPLFSDGYQLGLTWRAWGDLMAAVWNTAEDTNRYSYTNFYMS